LVLLLAYFMAGNSGFAAEAISEQTKVAIAGEQYGSPPGGLFFFGADYRNLWTVPVRVEVLDLHSVAGGLKPVMRVGGNSTKGLALKGADGRDYTFRSVNKDLSRTVPVEFQDSVLVDIVQDQIAANVPGVQVVIPTLYRALGMLGGGEARLVVMPDDAALGGIPSGFRRCPRCFSRVPATPIGYESGFSRTSRVRTPASGIRSTELELFTRLSGVRRCME
jgi:hypothetical protein